MKIILFSYSSRNLFALSSLSFYFQSEKSYPIVRSNLHQYKRLIEPRVVWTTNDLSSVNSKDIAIYTSQNISTNVKMEKQMTWKPHPHFGKIVDLQTYYDEINAEKSFHVITNGSQIIIAPFCLNDNCQQGRGDSPSVKSQYTISTEASAIR